jgi:ferredoxin
MLVPTWPEVALLLTITAVSVFLFLRRLVPVIHIIRSSKPDPGTVPDATEKRIKDFIWEVLFQAKVIRERPLPGLAHAFVFWGFLAFALVSINHFANGFGRSFFTEDSVFGAFYLALAALFACFVILAMVGLGIRRFIVQPKWLGSLSLESGIITILILILMVTYLFGYGVLREGTPAARTNWWVHTLTLLVFLPLLPHTKHLHLLLSPFTIFLSRGSFSRIPPLEGDDDFGIDTGKDITDIVALQAFSCVECGRCTEHCPANNTGKLLDPKQVILGVRRYLRDHGANGEEPIVGKYVPEKMLWQCTSCGACE